MTDEPSPFRGRRADEPWLWNLAVAFVLLTLIALVLLPWNVRRRIATARAEIVAAEPARTLVMQWQFNLIREMTALSELLLTGDTAQVRTYRTAVANEEEIYEDLAVLARNLEPAVLERFVVARTLSEQWHRRYNDVELLRLRATGVSLMQIPRERRLFERVLQTVADVDSTIVLETRRTRARIEAVEQTGLWITLGLGVLALIAAAAVISLGVRIRRFAAEAERRRQQAAEALAESARAHEARTRLLRGITHDVKNPLGAAKGYAELLAMGVKAPVAPEQMPLVAGIERSIDSALEIIADLLDLARVGSGSVTVNRVQADLTWIVRQAVDDFRAQVESAGHTIVVDGGRSPLVAFTDPLRVRQIVDNLLSNAIKYTPPPGRIVVSAAEKTGDGAPRPGSWAAIEVADTGPGIPPEHRETVFDEFSRLDDTSPTKGHGLGLAIARGLARQLGGELCIEDSDDGARFVLWIPQRG